MDILPTSISRVRGEISTHADRDEARMGPSKQGRNTGCQLSHGQRQRMSARIHTQRTKFSHIVANTSTCIPHISHTVCNSRTKRAMCPSLCLAVCMRACLSVCLSVCLPGDRAATRCGVMLSSPTSPLYEYLTSPLDEPWAWPLSPSRPASTPSGGGGSEVIEAPLRSRFDFFCVRVCDFGCFGVFRK
jgi:hypothetical protein